MKKLISLILITILIFSSQVYAFDPIDIFVPELVPADNNNQVDETLTGAANGYEVLFNTVFRDIGTTTYEKEIIKMAAEGAIEKYGSYDFNPEADMTGYEALAFLVRYQGNEAIVQENVLNNAQGLDLETVQQLFNEEYLTQAQNTGIVIPAETTRLNQPITKETLAKWIFRVSDLEEQFEDLSQVFGFNDWLEVDPANRGIIQAVVNNGIMSYDNDGNFNPDKAITRGEMANIMNNLSEASEEDRNITSNFGLVMDVVTRTEDNTSIREIYIKNADDTNTMIETRRNDETNVTNDFATYKNGIASSAKNIAVGDEIHYFYRDDEVYFAEVLGDQSVLDKINEINDSQEDLNLLIASVKEIAEERHAKADTVVSQKRIRLTTVNGNTYDLLVETDLTTGVTDDVLVFKDDKAAGVDLLEIGDTMTLLIKEDSKVVYISVGDVETNLVSGTVRSINEEFIEVFDYNDRIQTLPLSPYNIIEVNNRPGTIDDLTYGQDVNLQVNNGFVTAIKSETFINPGYIPEFGKVQTGSVYKKFNTGIYFLLNNGDKKLYQVPDETIILKEGRTIDPLALKEGDQVKLYFNDIYTDQVAKIEVDGRERLISQVYKGTLENFNNGDMSLTLSRPSQLRNNNWELLEDYHKTITLDDQVKIYDGSQPVRLNDLIKNYKDEMIYLVVEAAYGEEKGVQLTLKKGGEFVLSDRIDTINQSLGRFELDNNMNLELTEGTMVLKDGRLIDQSLLTKDDAVLVVSDYFQGRNQASIVKVTTLSDNVFDNIYFGMLEDVNISSVTFKNHTDLNGNEFNQIDPQESRKYYYFTESVIKDISDEENVQTLSRSDLFHGGYARVENKSEDGDGVPYERYYGYFVTNGNLGIIGMNLRHKGLLKNQDIDDTENKESDANEVFYETLEDSVLSRGIITERLDVYNRLKMTDTHDYMGYQGGWVPNQSDAYFEHTDAVIVKGNQAIEAEDIEIGDYVYLLRINEDALVIFVEDE